MRRVITTRRHFLAAAGATLAIGPSFGQSKPSERLNVAFIGYGKRCYRVLPETLRQKDVQVVAVCEVEGTRMAAAKQLVEKHYAAATKSGAYKGCDTYVDFRELLQRDDLDAVIIMTPDHLHVHQSLAAIKAGLDVYCEKPLTHTIAEGRMLCDAVKKAGTIFQTGSQQRSEFGDNFRNAVEMIWAGRIGEIKKAYVGVKGPPIPCGLPEQSKPDNVNWDLWLGPAPERGYNEELCPKGVHTHFPNFRAYEEYAGGYLADMGAHHFDIVQWALDMDGSGPVSVEPPPAGDTGLKFTYANGVEVFHGGDIDCHFFGTEGEITVSRGEITAKPANLLDLPLTEKDHRVMPSNNHMRNWLDAVKARTQPICTAEIGHRSATVCHLANIGYKLRTKLTWDPVKEEFVGNAEANALRSRKPRKGWEYPV